MLILLSTWQDSMNAFLDVDSTCT